MSDLNHLIANGRNAMGYTEISNSDGTPRHVLPKRAASVMTMSLRNATALTQPANPLRLLRSGLPDAGTAGKVIALDTALAASSRCVEAGSPVIVVPAAEEARIINGEPVFEQRDIHFDLIEPTRATRHNGNDLPLSPLGIFRDYVNVENMPSFGIHVSLSRREMKQFKEGELAASAMASIILGLGRAVDEVLLGTILYSNPSPFTLQAAAATGLRFTELRGMVGTDAKGAVIAANGGLVALAHMSTDTGGFPAELTDVMAETVIGDFSRAAVAIHEEIRLVADRTGTDGSMTLTAFAGIQALLPRPGVFWVRG